MNTNPASIQVISGDVGANLQTRDMTRLYQFSTSYTTVEFDVPGSTMRRSEVDVAAASAVPLDPTAEQVRALFSILDKVAEAQPPSVPTVARAAALLAGLVSVAAKGRAQWKYAHICVSDSGQIVLEWWHGSRKLTVYVSEEAAEYLQVWGPNMKTQMHEGSLTTQSDVDAVWKWLLAP